MPRLRPSPLEEESEERNYQHSGPVSAMQQDTTISLAPEEIIQ
ncbi:hypothetical protein [Neolewinella maritima]|nr:hypothetical protein [Neolewinella maritima]